MPTPHASRRAMLAVLHPVFALTGVGCAATGPLLPLLARDFHLSDSQSGLFVFWIYSGMAAGALLCRGNYARIMAAGFAAFAAACLGLCFAPAALLFPCAFFYGVAVSVPMTGTSLFAGRNYTARRAATLAALNFSWSLGAMAGPLFVARVLAVLNWRAVYVILAGAAVLAGFACLALRDAPEPARIANETTGARNLRLIAIFAVFFFLEVGLESTSGAWLSTYVLRTATTGVVLAAAASSIFWGGFLAGRALAPLILLRMRAARLLRSSLLIGLAAAVLLIASRSAVPLAGAILLLGLALAPVFPVALSMFFDRARRSSDSRFVLALSGFGGAVLPWLAGAISSSSGSIRSGLCILPATLLVTITMLPLLAVSRVAPAPAKKPEGEPSGHVLL